jgi:hypothetical protein
VSETKIFQSNVTPPKEPVLNVDFTPAKSDDQTQDNTASPSSNFQDGEFDHHNQSPLASEDASTISDSKSNLNASSESNKRQRSPERAPDQSTPAHSMYKSFIAARKS